MGMVIAALLAASACGVSESAVPSPSDAITPAGTSLELPPPSGADRAPTLSKGCGTSTVGALDLDKHTVDVNGAERWYLLTTPAKHDGHTPVPLVFDWHGLAEGAQIHSLMSRLGELGKSDGFVVVQPQGTGQPVKWDAKPGPGNQDLAFFDLMFDQLSTQLCFDTSRVYSTGLSYGAIMTSFLLCARSEKFAAVAPVAGLQLPESCDQTRKVPILAFHGTADPILLFNGGVANLGFIFGDGSAPRSEPPAADLNGPGYPAYVASWAKRYGCQSTPTDTKITDEVIHRVYDCPAASPVEFYIIIGGGHAWPGSAFSKAIEKIVGPTTSDIDASKEAWKFFQRFALPS